MTLPDTDDAGQHLTTKDGWRRFVAGGPKPPHIPAPSPKSYAKLPRATRLKLDDLRIDHHARLMVVATSTVRRTVATGRRLVMLNRHAISARRGLIVSGPAGTGKTIALTQLGLAHELNDRHVHPDAHGRIPVLYITVPPAACGCPDREHRRRRPRRRGRCGYGQSRSPRRRPRRNLTRVRRFALPKTNSGATQHSRAAPRGRGRSLPAKIASGRIAARAVGQHAFGSTPAWPEWHVR